MKRFLVIILAVCILASATGCAPSHGTEEATVASVEPAVLTTLVVEPTPTPVPTPQTVIFHRVDDNPAEFAVSEGEVKNIEIIGSGENERKDTFYILYLVKDRLENGKAVATIGKVNVYTGSDAPSGYEIISRIDGNHIFVSSFHIEEFIDPVGKNIKGEFANLYFSRANRKNGVEYYSLFELTSDYENRNSSDYAITNIARFLEVSDNKIYYLSTDGNVYSFEMTTQEIALAEGYEVIDYSSLPEGIDDYTAEYVLTYDDESKQIDITNISIENGAFVVGDLWQSVGCSELDGKIVDIKAGFDALFIATQQGKTNTIYRYDMFDKTYETLYQTEYEFDCSYVTQDDYFAAFYDGNYHIQAIKYNFIESNNRLIYDGDTCAYWEHVRPNEDTVDEVVEHPRYKDINYMTYKGNMLFGFHIDSDGVTTLVFKSDVIDRELLPRP